MTRGAFASNARRISLVGLGLGLVIAPLVACRPAPRPPPPPSPPPTNVVVRLERISLRANAYVELHAWLAAAARSGAPVPGGLERARHTYVEAFEEDDRDELWKRVARDVAACSDDACTGRVLAPLAIGSSFEGAAPAFRKLHWMERAPLDFAAMEAARAAMGPEIEPIVLRLATDLDVTWPSEPIAVDVVNHAPPPGRDAPLEAALSAGGACFARHSKETLKIHDARVIDCVLAHAFERAAPHSGLRAALGGELSGSDADRAWTLVVTHAVAATLLGWEPKHDSVTRRSAAASAPKTLAWLSQQWRARAVPPGQPREDVVSFAKRLAAEITREAEDDG